MKSKLLLILSVFILLSGMVTAPKQATAHDLDCLIGMSVNPDKIAINLMERGELSPEASPQEVNAAVQAYLQQKLEGCDPDKSSNPLARKKINAMEAALTNTPGEIRGRKLGSEASEVDPSTPQFKPLGGADQLLLILIEFSDTPFTWTSDAGEERTEAGPLHNLIPLPDNDFDLWVEDFSPEHYTDMLFTPGGWTFSETHPYYPGEKRGSMRDYFLAQSYGTYAVDGDTYGWFTVDKPEAYYGDDSPDGGSDNLRPGSTGDLLADAIAKVNEEGAIDWLTYDLTDPYDLDSDGNLAEPDCILDHPLFIHAGIDQSGGGGAQGDDAIWAHSSSTWEVVTDVKNTGAACPDSWPGTMLYNYTIMPEDGGVGIFAHEYAHDLGLPDEYDTIYSGNGDSNAFWTLQSSGSWIGRPAQTQPSGMSAWAKYVLGWLDPETNLAALHLDDLDKEPTLLRLEQTEYWGGEGTYNGIKIDLPDKYFYINTPYSGEWEWFGGKADEIDTTLRRTVDLTAAASAELSFWTWYEIEDYWDFGFVQVSTDGGATWTSLPIDGVTTDNDVDAMESIVANLPGFTGVSGGWVNKSYDLAGYLGQTIELQFRYMTDWGTSLAGFYIDDVRVTTDGVDLFFDDVELLDENWIADGWTRDMGAGYSPQYYIMEWRNLLENKVAYDDIELVNFDAGLNNAYSFDAYGETPNQPSYFPYAPGLLLFYRDMSYTDNWTGAHPGGGFMLIVDAHDRPLIEPPYKANPNGLPWRTRIQSYDAAFSLDPAADITLTKYGVTCTYYANSVDPTFNDYQTYWNKKASSASVITPKLGLLFRVLGQAEDNSAALIGFGNRINLLEEYLTFDLDFFNILSNLFLPLVRQ